MGKTRMSWLEFKQEVERQIREQGWDPDDDGLRLDMIDGTWLLGGPVDAGIHAEHDGEANLVIVDTWLDRQGR